jgi:hypothetical protein
MRFGGLIRLFLYNCFTDHNHSTRWYVTDLNCVKKMGFSVMFWWPQLASGMLHLRVHGVVFFQVILARFGALRPVRYCH